MSYDPAIIAASIAAVAAIVSALLSGITQHLFRKRREDVDKLRSDLEAAIQDIDFLLKVEERHCDLNKERGDAYNKVRVRDHVRQTTGLQWSGQFTPGRAQDRLNNR